MKGSADRLTAVPPLIARLVAAGSAEPAPTPGIKQRQTYQAVVGRLLSQADGSR